MYGPCPNRHNGLYLKNRLQIVSSFALLTKISLEFEKKDFQRMFILAFPSRLGTLFQTLEHSVDPKLRKKFGIGR